MGKGLLGGIIIFVFFFLISERLVFSQAGYTSLDLRDPFENQLSIKAKSISSAQSGSIVPPKLEVQSIVISNKIGQAIVNGNVVQAGDRIENAIVTDISKDSVEVLYQGEAFSFPSPVKRLLALPKSKPPEEAKKK